LFVGSVSDLSVEQALLLDEACTRFDAKWRSGGRPDILAALLELPEALHPVALRELVQVDIHYRRRSGTPATAEEYLARFPQLAPAELAAFLASHSNSSTPSNGKAEPRSTVPYESFGNYELLGELDRGGMGIVYRARDKRLNRVVAVKFLHPRYAAGSFAARRFLDEATITGQLQHPGIPPVHEVGELPDGRPFIAMKLISGRTLDEILADGSMTRGALVAAFEHICQAVAYAHARGVIHRDLKPRNVMVGAFGEVQVMDWGLAKVRPGAGTDTVEASAADTFHDPRSAADEHARTRTGCRIGTPGYMAPEQALGALDQIDERSDVFGLGGILCAILTGQPPFVAPNPESARQLAAEKNLGATLARLDACGADRELVAICKGCLAAEPVERPRNAGAVADALQSYRVAAEERARRAELDRVRAEGERAKAELQVAEQRKRRKVQLALLAAGLLLVTGGGAFAWWENDQSNKRRIEETLQAGETKGRETRNRDRFVIAHEQCESALRTDDAYTAAIALGELEKRFLEGGVEDFAPRVERSRKDLAMLEELDRIDLYRWTRPADGWVSQESAVTGRWKQAFAQFGIAPGSTPVNEAIRSIHDSLIRDRLLGALDLWLVYEPSQKTLAETLALADLLKAADRDDYRDALRAEVRSNDYTRLLQLAESPSALEQPHRFAVAFGAYFVVPAERRRALLAKTVVSRPKDIAVLIAMAETYPINTPEGAAERARWFQAAVATRPQNVAAWHGLGSALYGKGDLDAAIPAFKAAMMLDPDYPHTNFHLNILLSSQHALTGSPFAKKQVPPFTPSLLGRPPHGGTVSPPGLPGVPPFTLPGRPPQPSESQLAGSSFRSGIRSYLLGDADGAIIAYQKALEFNPTCTPALHNLAAIYLSQKKYPEAIAYARAVITANPRFPLDEPEVPFLMLDQDNAHVIRNEALVRTGDINGTRATWMLDQAITHVILGEALVRTGDIPGARAAWTTAARQNTRWAYLLARLPPDPVAPPQPAVAPLPGGTPLRSPDHVRAILHLQKRDFDQAVPLLEKAVEADRNSAPALLDLGFVYNEKRQFDKAIPCFKKVIALDRKNVTAHNNLGAAYNGKERYDEAIRCFDEAIKLDPYHLPAHSNRAFAYNAKKEYDKAISDYEKALAINDRYIPARLSLGDAYNAKRDHNKAVMCFKRVLELDRNNVVAHISLGFTYNSLGRYEDAIPCLKKAFALDPKRATAPNNLGFAYNAVGLRDEGIPLLKKAVELSPKSSIYLSNLAVGLRDAGDLKPACETLKQALALVPETAAQHKGWKRDLEQWEALLALERDLPELVKGERKSASFLEGMKYGNLCRCKQHYSAALRFYEEALAHDPDAAKKLGTGVLTELARTALLVAAGKGSDPPPEADRPFYRARAHAWLQQLVKGQQEALEKNFSANRHSCRIQLRVLMQHIDLAPVRPPALNNLPAAEGMAWDNFWNQVERLLEKADALPPDSSAGQNP
jgi:tetratricopeptide (TPR) repeat protein/tRNA A-37 threonylcarbamoyl transferase component Bud32